MDTLFRSYLALLVSLREKLEQLCDLAREKTAAVRADDLLKLDEILKKEQALSLAFRGLEQKRDRLLREMGMTQVPLSGLIAQYPPELRLEAKQTVEALQNQYQIYRAASEVARNTLECSLHQIEKVLSEFDSAAPAGPGYAPPQAEPPQSMKTDFRV